MIINIHKTNKSKYHIRDYVICLLINLSIQIHIIYFFYKQISLIYELRKQLLEFIGKINNYNNSKIKFLQDLNEAINVAEHKFIQQIYHKNIFSYLANIQFNQYQKQFVNSCSLIGKHTCLIYNQLQNILHHILHHQQMFDYRRMAIEFSQQLFGSILERFQSKIPKLKYPDEYTSYTRQMYHKYCQIMDHFNILFQKMEGVQERLSNCQKKQFLFLQLIKISNRTPNSQQIQKFIKNTSKLLPSEECLFNFFKHYSENKKVLQEIKCALNIGQQAENVAFTIIKLKKDLEDAKELIKSKIRQINELKDIIYKMPIQLLLKMAKDETIIQQNEKNNDFLNRSQEIMKIQNSEIQLFMDYKTRQIALLMNRSEFHDNFKYETYDINATMQLYNDKLSYSNQVLRDTIVRLNLQKNQLNKQIVTIKAVLETKNVKQLQIIQNFIKKQQWTTRQYLELQKKNQDLKQQNVMLNNYIQQYIRDKYQLYKENQILKNDINQLNQLTFEQIDDKNQQILNLKNDCQMLNDEFQRLQAQNSKIISTLETNINSLTDKYKKESKYRQLQIKKLSLKVQSLQVVEKKLLSQIKEFQVQILQHDKLVKKFGQEKQICKAKIQQLNRYIDNLRNSCLKLRHKLDKYEQIEQLWLILDDTTTEITVEETII